MSAIKRAVAEKIWKLLGELKQGSDGSLTMRIGLRSGGSAQLLWRKFQVAYTQRKLIVTFDDAGMNLVIPGRGPGSYGVDMEGEDPSIVASVDSGLRDDVMKLAKANPELRVHLVPLLQKDAGILDSLFKRYKKDHPNSKEPPQSLKDKAEEMESGADDKKEPSEEKKPLVKPWEKEKQEKADKEKAEKDKADKDKADKEKAKKDKSDKADREVSELSDEDLDKHDQEHEEKSKARKKKDRDFTDAQLGDDPAYSGQGGGGNRGYVVDRTHSDEEKDDAEHHERLKKEKGKRKTKQAGLRVELVRLAQANPELRAHLVPLLQKNG